MGIKFSNNASSSITHALTADATSISITPGTGDLFPSIVEGTDYFYATLAGNNGLEIVKVTKRVLDTMTVERAQDNTDALLFDIGDLFELRIVAADFEDTFAKVDSMLEESLEENTSMVNAALANKAPTSHASANTTHGVGTEDLYGHVKLSDDASELYGVSEGIAATPLAVNKAKNDAVDEAVSKSASDSSTLVSSLDSTLRTFIEEKTAEYLPLEGGTMSGDINFTGKQSYIKKDSTDGFMTLCGSTSPDYGGFFRSYGNTYDGDNRGGAAMVAVGEDGSKVSAILRPSGDMTIGGKSVITSSGGNIYGNLKFNPEPQNGINALVANREDAYLQICGSPAWGTGAVCTLHGKLYMNKPGWVELRAADSTNAATLVLKPDGSLLRSGNTVPSVVTWRSGNNWYRKWSDGWIEQGGFFRMTTGDTRTVSISLNTAFTTNYYTTQISLYRTTDSDEHWGSVGTRTTSAFNIHSRYIDANHGFFWYAYGI